MAHTEWWPSVRLKHSVQLEDYGVGGFLAIMAQWLGGSSQSCPGFDSQWLPTFSLPFIFAL